MDETTLARFLAKVERDPVSGCWLWTGARSRQGYGHFRVGRYVLRAHRVAHEHFIGPIPEHLDVCHRCDTPSCVAPGHLFVGTALDNVTDMLAKGRSRSGEANAAKTCCPQGHEYTPENTYLQTRRGTTMRQCLECRRARDRRRPWPRITRGADTARGS
jgi:hypothetical protein